MFHLILIQPLISVLEISVYSRLVPQRRLEIWWNDIKALKMPWQQLCCDLRILFSLAGGQPGAGDTWHQHGWYEWVWLVGGGEGTLCWPAAPPASSPRRKKIINVSAFVLLVIPSAAWPTESAAKTGVELRAPARREIVTNKQDPLLVFTLTCANHLNQAIQHLSC